MYVYSRYIYIYLFIYLIYDDLLNLRMVIFHSYVSNYHRGT